VVGACRAGVWAHGRDTLPRRIATTTTDAANAANLCHFIRDAISLRPDASIIDRE